MDDYTQRVLAQRKAKDEFFASSDHSPLDRRALRRFDGLAYYPPDPALVFTVTPEPGDGALLQIQATDGDVRSYRRAAVAHFEVGGEPVSLALYDTGHPGYFLPFRDRTSGSETYGAGRYLDIEPNDDGTVTIDFNEAYNPFCAYNEAYACPLPPPENWLQVRIEAGEQVPPAHG